MLKQVLDDVKTKVLFWPVFLGFVRQLGSRISEPDLPRVGWVLTGVMRLCVWQCMAWIFVGPEVVCEVFGRVAKKTDSMRFLT